MENNIFYVYTWTRPDTNEVFYIGKGHGNRINSTKSRNKHVLNVIKKCGGIKNIIKEKLYENLDENLSFDLEKETIAKYRELLGEKLLNISIGGDGSAGWYDTLTEEEKEKHKEISKSWTGRKHTEEEKRKMAESKRGKKHSEETNKKVSETRKQKFKNGELICYWKGRHLSEETKKKISESRRKKFANGEYRDTYKTRRISWDVAHMKYLSQLANEKRTIIKYIIFNKNLEILGEVYNQDDIKNFGLLPRTAREYMKRYKEKNEIMFHTKLNISALPEELYNKLISQSTIENISE